MGLERLTFLTSSECEWKYLSGDEDEELPRLDIFGIHKFDMLN